MTVREIIDYTPYLIKRTIETKSKIIPGVMLAPKIIRSVMVCPRCSIDVSLRPFGTQMVCEDCGLIMEIIHHNLMEITEGTKPHSA